MVPNAVNGPHADAPDAQHDDTGHDRIRAAKVVSACDPTNMASHEPVSYTQEEAHHRTHLRNWIYLLRKESRPLVSELAKVSGHGPEHGTTAETRVVGLTGRRRTRSD